MTTQANGRSNSERRIFESELLKHLDSLKAFGVSLAHRQDKAEDLAQLTVEKALHKWESYTPGTNMKAWLFTIMRNEFYSQMRKGKREVGWIEGLENSLEYSTLESDGGMTYDFKKHLAYIASLPTEYRDAFVAVCYLGLDYVDVATIFRCATGTIKSRVSRGRDRLVKLIESNVVILEATFDNFKHATRGIPESDPFYPIAKAYEELFANAEDIKEKSVFSAGPATAPKEVSERDGLWEQLVRSGALDDTEDDLATLMQSELEG